MTRRGFSLLELLVVIAIVVIVTATALSASREEAKEVEVRVAAQELASVFRETRAKAMRTRSCYAVVFNITNAPGSSGRVLNNRSGGHWYRVLGPGQRQGAGVAANVPMFNRGSPSLLNVDGSAPQSWGMPGKLADNPIRPHLEAVEEAWIEEPRVLPKGKVRFLALRDQDNGDVRSAGDTYAPTYPRPWFGTWDPATKRIHPWGGYDPDLPLTTQTGPWKGRHKPRTVGGRTISHTGFFYEGLDGPIVGCVQPSDRLVLDDTNADGRFVIDPAQPGGSDDPTKRYLLWRAGEERPLINAAWQDFMIVFRPDGTVRTQWFRLRHQYAYRYDETDRLCFDPAGYGTNGDALAPAGQFHLRDLGPYDLCNRIGRGEGYPDGIETHGEATSWVKRSGYHYITLAPDQHQDRDTYPDLDAYLDELSPCYRVGISPDGDVRVLRVRRTPLPGQALDTTLTGSDWNTTAATDLYYRNGLLTDATGKPQGSPVIDTVSAEMLQLRTWWWK